ncbi:unnamed protein product [Vitrella brassicaformis CCMP3155]|uniref:Inositol polyphosphate-related phosphatase domain-containing protein n=1 Tax=Vitrella brassicaformis (strain CCMP3155) TaxID=1169540 RepID=A0A0G4FB10_VITBC|nr:unnamed protein product [Vitrella brassicaformis CCMP3155]|eukprot:CEM10112.1 unnamed protein product [Vitrella brassicaformis CCMP3155]
MDGISMWVGTWNVGARDGEWEAPPVEGQYELADFIDASCDILLLTLQEHMTNFIYALVSGLLELITPSKFSRLELPQSQVGGLGDGAFLQPKYTSIACWVRRDLLARGVIQLLRTAIVPLGMAFGSKGAAGVALRVGRARVAFIGCHLPASSNQARKEALDFILRRSGWLLEGHSEPIGTGAAHVVLAGDLNFRLRPDLQPPQAVALLKDGHASSLLAWDEGKDEMRRGGLLVGYEEASMGPDFFPTYKKKENRRPFDMRRPDWMAAEYTVVHTLQWYKGGGKEWRLPAFCDRVLFKQAPRSGSQLGAVASSYRAIYTTPPKPTHRLLNMSDHSAVCCSLALRNQNAPHRSTSIQCLSSPALPAPSPPASETFWPSLAALGLRMPFEQTVPSAPALPPLPSSMSPAGGGGGVWVGSSSPPGSHEDS